MSWILALGVLVGVSPSHIVVDTVAVAIATLHSGSDMDVLDMLMSMLLQGLATG